jgi:hypothetical protein
MTDQSTCGDAIGSATRRLLYHKRRPCQVALKVTPDESVRSEGITRRFGDYVLQWVRCTTS